MADFRRWCVRTLAWPIRTHSTAGSLVYIEDKSGSVLMVKTRYNRDQWTLPGGFHRRNETALKCAIRETREETGLDVSDTLAHVRTYKQDHQPHYDHLYKDAVKSPRPQVGSIGFWRGLEIRDVAWIDIRSSELDVRLTREAAIALDEVGKNSGNGFY